MKKMTITPRMTINCGATSNRSDDFALHLMNANGSNERRLLDTPEDEFDPVFSLSGNQIALTCGKELEEGAGTFHQFVVKSSGERLLRLTNTSDGVFNLHPEWKSR